MKKTTEQVLAELTGDDRTVTEAADHYEVTLIPCACGAGEDHEPGRDGAL